MFSMTSRPVLVALFASSIVVSGVRLDDDFSVDEAGKPGHKHHHGHHHHKQAPDTDAGEPEDPVQKAVPAPGDSHNHVKKPEMKMKKTEMKPCLADPVTGADIKQEQLSEAKAEVKAASDEDAESSASAEQARKQAAEAETAKAAAEQEMLKAEKEKTAADEDAKIKAQEAAREEQKAEVKTKAAADATAVSTDAKLKTAKELASAEYAKKSAQDELNLVRESTKKEVDAARSKKAEAEARALRDSKRKQSADREVTAAEDKAKAAAAAAHEEEARHLQASLDEKKQQLRECDREQKYGADEATESGVEAAAAQARAAAEEAAAFTAARNAERERKEAETARQKAETDKIQEEKAEKLARDEAAKKLKQSTAMTAASKKTAADNLETKKRAETETLHACAAKAKAEKEAAAAHIIIAKAAEDSKHAQTLKMAAEAEACAIHAARIKAAGEEAASASRELQLAEEVATKKEEEAVVAASKYRLLEDQDSTWMNNVTGGKAGASLQEASQLAANAEDARKKAQEDAAAKSELASKAAASMREIKLEVLTEDSTGVDAEPDGIAYEASSSTGSTVTPAPTSAPVNSLIGHIMGGGAPCEGLTDDMIDKLVTSDDKLEAKDKSESDGFDSALATFHANKAQAKAATGPQTDDDVITAEPVGDALIQRSTGAHGTSSKSVKSSHGSKQGSQAKKVKK